MGEKMTISAVVLMGGDPDGDLFRKCIASLDWVDEIVEVETGNIKGGFSEWRNEGMRRAKGDWVLFVDTDEEVTHELRNEMVKLLNDSRKKHSGYAIPRRNFIFGREFKHGGQWPDYQKRLFKKDSFKKWTGPLHEEPYFEGSLGHLKNPLLHNKKITISQMVEKTNKWSEIEAKLMFEAKHPPVNFLRFFSAAFREFWLRMIVQLSFLDGIEGVIYAIYQVYSRLISYSKLWEMQLKNK